MRGRVAGLMVGLVAVLVAAGGCTSETGGSPTPRPTTGVSGSAGPSSGPSAPGEGETYGAPPVDVPLDATAFLTQPCAVLSRGQLAAFDVSRAGIAVTTGAVAEQAGPFCVWHASPERSSTIGVGFLTGNKNGLSDTYRGREGFEYFKPTTVEGYPAVYANDPDLRSSGHCLIVVGISDSLTFNASEQGRLDARGACERALAVAKAALATLKGGD